MDSLRRFKDSSESYVDRQADFVFQGSAACPINIGTCGSFFDGAPFARNLPCGCHARASFRFLRLLSRAKITLACPSRERWF
ncbi:hypothetical protein ES703_18248 [subsurface metagenome]